MMRSMLPSGRAIASDSEMIAAGLLISHAGMSWPTSRNSQCSRRAAMVLGSEVGRHRSTTAGMNSSL